MGEGGAYGDRIARRFGLSSAPAMTVRTASGSLLAVTRLQCAVVPACTAPLAREPAFAIMAHLPALPAGDAAPGGHGAVYVADLAVAPQAAPRGAFDGLHFYVPRAALDEMADRAGAARIATLSWPEAAPDPILGRLASCLVPVLDQTRYASQFFVDHVALALLAHFAHAYGGMRVAPLVRAGGLAPWQERRAKEILSARMAAEVSLAEVARACELSIGHFTRAFRRSTGLSPHRWLCDRRLERARQMLVESALPLAEVALVCGYADQSHFTRVFTRTAGTSPGAWRRNKKIRPGALPLDPAGA